MKTLLLDVDGFLADCPQAVHRVAEQILARKLPLPENWSSWEFHLAMNMSSTEKELFDRAMLFDDDIGWKIDLYPGAEEFVLNAARRYDVCFVTAQWKRMSHWCVARENLLNNYFPDIDVVFTRSKFRVAGDFLVDDQPDHVMNLSEKCKGILFDRPWNRNFRIQRRAMSYEHLNELLELV